MLQLTLHEPFAHASVYHPELKGFETRSWRPVAATLERCQEEGVIIHSALKPDGSLMRRRAARRYAEIAGGTEDDWYYRPGGYAIGVINLVNIIPIVTAYNEFTAGQLRFPDVQPDCEQIVVSQDAFVDLAFGVPLLAHYPGRPLATGERPVDLTPMALFGLWDHATWAWQYGRTRPLPTDPPIKLRGQQGLRDTTDGMEARIYRILGDD